MLCIKSTYSESRVFREAYLNPLVDSDVDSGSGAVAACMHFFFSVMGTVHSLFTRYLLSTRRVPRAVPVVQ